MPHDLDEYRETHQLCDVLGREGVLAVRFLDARDFELSGCCPVDTTIHGDAGRWCCTVERCLSTAQKDQQLFRPGSGIDILEQDIAAIIDRATGEILYTKS
jgi:hypothetical protein